MNKLFCEYLLEVAAYNVTQDGGPFAALITYSDKIISIGANTVINDNSPIAHAEINAIKEACNILGTIDLSDCELYTSCEPCPMCLGAVYWAKIKTIYYIASRFDAKNAGFKDADIYEDMSATHIIPKNIKLFQVPMPKLNKLEPFKMWLDKKDRKEY